MRNCNFAFLLLLVGAVSSGSQTKPAGLTAKSIILTVTVTNKQGYISGLSSTDFAVFAGKTPLDVTSISFGDEPMSIGDHLGYV